MSLQVWRMLQKPLYGNQMNLATLRVVMNLLGTRYVADYSVPLICSFPWRQPLP